MPTPDRVGGKLQSGSIANVATYLDVGTRGRHRSIPAFAGMTVSVLVGRLVGVARPLHHASHGPPPRVPQGRIDAVARDGTVHDATALDTLEAFGDATILPCKAGEGDHPWRGRVEGRLDAMAQRITPARAGRRNGGIRFAIPPYALQFIRARCPVPPSPRPPIGSGVNSSRGPSRTLPSISPSGSWSRHRSIPAFAGMTVSVLTGRLVGVARPLHHRFAMVPLHHASHGPPPPRSAGEDRRCRAGWHRPRCDGARHVRSIRQRDDPPPQSGGGGPPVSGWWRGRVEGR